MSDVTKDASSNISESNGSEMGACLQFKLDNIYMDKLYTIMKHNDHFLFSDSLKMLIDLEYDRIQESTNADI